MEQVHPFDDAQGTFFILINECQQYSLWPQACALPQGWKVVCESQSQEACFRWLAQHNDTLQPACFMQ